LVLSCPDNCPSVLCPVPLVVGSFVDSFPFLEVLEIFGNLIDIFEGYELDMMMNFCYLQNKINHNKK